MVDRWPGRSRFSRRRCTSTPLLEFELAVEKHVGREATGGKEASRHAGKLEASIRPIRPFARSLAERVLEVAGIGQYLYTRDELVLLNPRTASWRTALSKGK